MARRHSLRLPCLLLFLVPAACAEDRRPQQAALTPFFRAESGLGGAADAHGGSASGYWDTRDVAILASSDVVPAPHRASSQGPRGAGAQSRRGNISAAPPDLPSDSLLVVRVPPLLGAAEHGDSRDSEAEAPETGWQLIGAFAEAARPRRRRPALVAPALQFLQRMAALWRRPAVAAGPAFVEQGAQNGAAETQFGYHQATLGELFMSSGAAFVLAFVVIVTAALAAFELQCTQEAEALPASDRGGIVAQARGQAHWIFLGWVMTTLMAFLAFFMTFLQVKVQNLEVQNFEAPPERQQLSPEDTIASACIAGAGVTLSTAFSHLSLAGFRGGGKVPISRSLLVVFFLRGAGLALVVAVSMETAGLALVAHFAGGVGGEPLDPLKGAADAPAAAAVAMFVVGFSEEVAKLGAVLSGVWLLAAELRSLSEAGVLGCMSRRYAVLVETPKSMLLAGLAVGFGFMTIENAGYFVMVVSDGGSKDVSFEAMSLVRMSIILVRIVFNLHPWLVAYSASRCARIIFVAPVGPAPALPSADFLRCVAPSVIIHGAYDFAMAAVPLPGPLVLLAPYACWCYARRNFMDEWDFWAGEQHPDLARLAPRDQAPTDETSRPRLSTSAALSFAPIDQPDPHPDEPRHSQAGAAEGHDLVAEDMLVDEGGCGGGGGGGRPQHTAVVDDGGGPGGGGGGDAAPGSPSPAPAEEAPGREEARERHAQGGAV